MVPQECGCKYNQNRSNNGWKRKNTAIEGERRKQCTWKKTNNMDFAGEEIRVFLSPFSPNFGHSGIEEIKIPKLRVEVDGIGPELEFPQKKNGQRRRRDLRLLISLR
ncbi:OLC1v1033475C1 [Oldenlandia corymbosa var. corymbosa]|uniref:OLC1v1033475C1 n=1 Tax=Oldenlandia corymbosa var. corymbosa TaxID=529605 RepID=A0AAV1CNZ7_OLDCO|nr:OLC1v1033475C1 [Oldenlandia corymbosa var. corymbosa]